MNNNPTTNQMDRAEFLRSLGMSSAALMAFYCMGTGLTACSKSDNAGVTPSPGGSVGVDLTASSSNALKTEGGYIYSGNIIVARVKGGNYVALSKVCTHQGTNVQYRLTQNDFWCPNHGSEFSTTGAVEVGPAASPLTVYKTALSADGNTLTITA